MEVVLPPGAGWSGLHLTGLRSAGATNGTEAAGAVVVKRRFRVQGTALVPDAAQPILLADAFVTDDEGNGWQTAEGETAIRKADGDVIVLGAAPPSNRGGFVRVGAATWLSRTGAPGDDVDLAANLFGWHPKHDPARFNDTRMLTSEPDSAADRLDRFFNAQRRAGGTVTAATRAALPEGASIAVRHRAADSGDPDIAVLDFTYDLPPLALTLMIAEPGVPDRKERWCPHAFGAASLDTLVIRPGNPSTVAALWRASWPAAAAPVATLRQAVVTEGTA